MPDISPAGLCGYNPRPVKPMGIYIHINLSTPADDIYQLAMVYIIYTLSLILHVIASTKFSDF